MWERDFNEGKNDFDEDTRKRQAGDKGRDLESASLCKLVHAFPARQFICIALPLAPFISFPKYESTDTRIYFFCALCDSLNEIRSKLGRL